MNKFDNRDILSKRLELALKMRNMKPIDLAKKSTVNRSSISQYLNKRCAAKQENIYAICKALDINEAWLMGMSDDITRIPDENRKSNTSIYRLNNHEDTSPFSTFDDAMLFIIKSPYASAYGGYDLDKLSEEEVINFANELAEMFKIAAKHYKK